MTGHAEWDAIRDRRREDLLIYLALAGFRKRPLLGQLPRTLQRDLRAFFGTYSRACQEADAPRFRTGDTTAIDEPCRHSPVGKLLPDDLYVHRRRRIRWNRSCEFTRAAAGAFLGEVERANLIKIHRRSGKLSYLVYPEFDADPHPELLRSIRVNLRTRQIDSNNYAQSSNPPVLHRKETFLTANYPLHDEFTRLTQQEEKHGLLEETAAIGTRND